MRPQRVMSITCCAWVVGLAIWGSGCGVPPQRKEVERTGILSWNPHLLFLNRMPHDSLYVEVDAVAGTEPSEEVVAELEKFLRQYCDKPGGIAVVRDDVIPRSAAVGYHHEALALQYLDGPASDGNAAFLYVLYFDSSLRPDPSTPERRPVHKHARLKAESRYVQPESPHINLQPYPAAIYIDRRYLRLMPGSFETLAVRHEAAHVLGLTRNPTHGAEYHCRRKNCLMAAHLNVGFFKLMFGQYPFAQANFCEACESDLMNGADERATNVRFAGPILVRSESEYHVGSLPAVVKLGVGDAKRFEVVKFLEQARRDGQRMKGQFKHRYWADFSAGRSEVERQIKELVHAQRDPLPMVRDAATQLVARAREMLEQTGGDARPADTD